MTGFFRRRRAVKSAREWLHHARACRNLREDVAPGADIDRLTAAEAVLRRAMEQRDVARMETECMVVQKAAAVVVPPRSSPGFRENLEVIVVAVAVAMAFRSFFLQPFKIPTGSMQPTLYGIHYTAQDEPGWLDASPLRALRWMVFGEWYVEFKAEKAGRVYGPRAEQGGMFLYDIGGLSHPIPRELKLLVKPGDEVVTGQVLARGSRVTGDHLFVNRVAWNVMAPRRGEIVVFRTDDIPALNDKKTHYIKRLCGLPGERISIRPPELLVDGKRAPEPGMLQAIQDRAPGYVGYQLARGMGAERISSTNDVMALEPGQYVGFGDNSMNSYDSRYWGPVKRANLVGPAFFVYWPFSSRWGFIR